MNPDKLELYIDAAREQKDRANKHQREIANRKSLHAHEPGDLLDHQARKQEELCRLQNSPDACTNSLHILNELPRVLTDTIRHGAEFTLTTIEDGVTTTTGRYIFIERQEIPFLRRSRNIPTPFAPVDGVPGFHFSNSVAGRLIAGKKCGDKVEYDADQTKITLQVCDVE